MEALEQFDASFEPTSRVPAVETVIPNGYFTISFPDGTHRTFRVHTKRRTAKFAPGQRVISLLVGPDNEADYQPFGFVTDEGVKVWRQYEGTGRAKFAPLFWKLALGECLEGYDLQLSKRCFICNRTLTDPESLKRGIGPECWRKAHE